MRYLFIFSKSLEHNSISLIRKVLFELKLFYTESKWSKDLHIWNTISILQMKCLETLRNNHTCTSRWLSGGCKISLGEKIFLPLGGVKLNFWPNKGGKTILLKVKKFSSKGEPKIFEQGEAKLPPGHTLNWGVQIKNNFIWGVQKKFSYGVLSSCACME